MPAPRTWREPTAGGVAGTAINVSRELLGFANGFALAVENRLFPGDGYDSNTYWRSDSVTTDFSDSFTMTALPTNYVVSYWSTEMVYADSTWAWLGVFGNTAGTAGDIYGILHSTDPMTSWSFTQLGAADDNQHRPTVLAYGNGEWIVGGTYGTAGSLAPLLGHCATIGGTWTYGTSVAETGYTAGHTITGIGYSNGTYVTIGEATAVTGIRHSSSLLSGWGTATMTNGGQSCRYVQSSGDWWAFSGLDNVTGLYSFWYTDDPSGTWLVEGPPDTDGTFGALRYCNGYWLQSWFRSADRNVVWWLQSTGSPAGTYTAANLAPLIEADGGGFGSGGGWYDSGTWLADGYANYGQILVGLGTSPTLRQRQSPRRSPSRVGWF